MGVPILQGVSEADVYTTPSRIRWLESMVWPHRQRRSDSESATSATASFQPKKSATLLTVREASDLTALNRLMHAVQ